MGKNPEEMSTDELWELFPIILSNHNPNWEKQYEQEKENIEKAIGKSQIVRISHVGSTSVSNLIAKPTVDILVEICEGTSLQALIEAMKRGGYLSTLRPDNPTPHMMFMKGYTAQGFSDQVFHVHIRYPGDWKELYFRDYLREHLEVAKEYGDLKISLKDRFEHDRDGYTLAKTEFIQKYTALARTKYGDRYEIRDNGLEA